jgi:hypothetical protein
MRWLATSWTSSACGIAWNCAPQTFHSPRPGDVFVAGSVIAQRAGVTREQAAAWSWGGSSTV